MKKSLQKNRPGFYAGFIDKVLQNDRIRKKYLVVYVLESIRDYGIIECSRVMFRTVRQNGLYAFLHPRRVILHRLHNRGAGSFLTYSPQKVSTGDLEKLREDLTHFTYRPKISIILPVYNTEIELLRSAVESVKRQIYENWELCIADDHSSDAGLRALLQSYAKDDKISIVHLPENSGISEASNAAIGISTGEFIALLDHDDEITSDALYWIVEELNKNSNADILYTDECKADKKGNLSDYFFKPDWSPELLFNMMYIGHLTVYRKEFLKEVGLFRKEFDFSQDYDLVLRATEKTGKIRHIKKVLYHWRITEGSASVGGKPYARKSNLRALESAIRRRNIDANIIELPAANRVKINIDPKPLVSIIIPTDSKENLNEALTSIYDMTDYPSYEIVVVTNAGLAKEMQKMTAQADLIWSIYDKAYNFSDKCNQGAFAAGGEIIIFFNDDVRPLDDGWLKNTIEYLFIPGVGGVSPKLIYENDSLQYTGMTTGVRGLIGTTFHGYNRDSIGYHHYPQLVRNVLILSGACLAIRKALFFEIGQFDAVNYPSAHSDIDLSFKLAEKGWRCVYTPYAVLRHFGHKSLKTYEKNQIPIKKDKSTIFILKQWLKYLPEDPYFPQPMKDFLYHDSPQPFRLYGYAKRAEDRNSKGDILVMTHDLSLTGAPISLFDLCKAAKTRGYFVVVCSPHDGPLREMYSQEGISVIVDSLLMARHDELPRFAVNFDWLICNTVVTWPIVRQMNDKVPVLWWLQEGRSILDFTQYRECAKTIREAKLIIGLSDYALAFIRKYNKNAYKIYNACPDRYDPDRLSAKYNQQEKVIFSLIGSMEKRKGQDILIDALDYVDDEILNKLEIQFIGRDHDPHFAGKIKHKAACRDFVRFSGEASRDECRELMKDTHVLVNASRDEAFSVAMVEGFSLAKPCIMPEFAGIAELVTDGINGLIFRQDDSRHLAEKISWAVNNVIKLKNIGLAARATYRKYLTPEEFENKIFSLLENKSINSVA